jgi:replicative DNA helicase
MLEAIGAERALLSILLKHPGKLFEIDDVIVENDFTNTGTRIIFSILHDLLITDRHACVDYTTLISHAEEKGVKEFLELTQGGELLHVLEQTSVNPDTLGKHVAAVKKAAIKRVTIETLDSLKDEVEEFNGHAIDLRNLVEEKILNTMRMVDKVDEDIVCLSNDFEETIEQYANYNAELGIDLGFPRWQRDCGGLRNGTVTGVFARAKVGKSQFSAYAVAQAAIEQRLPSLYLDTELQARDQQMRLCGILSGVSFSRIETGAWKNNDEEMHKVKAAFKKVKGAPLYYKNIAGKSYKYVIPIIRKFVHQYVGESVGEKPKCLVVYDYIKLMDMNDLKHAQEYQVLGFLMSAIHDIAAQLNIPILALGQLNRDGLKLDNEATVSGSDRITHNLDSLTLFRPKNAEEIGLDGEAMGTHIFKTVLARKGPGHGYNECLNVHFNKSSGQFREGHRQSEIISTLQQQHNLSDDDIAQFGTVRED